MSSKINKNLTCLAEALKKYYKREKTKILFVNGASLQEFAISMWEKLGYSQIDTSVVSRVLNGQRLFTPIQLEAFCEVLKLSESESSYLMRCLTQDYLIKGGARNALVFETTSIVDTLDFLDSLVKETHETFHDGLGVKIQKNCAVIQSYIDRLSTLTLTDTHKNKLYELMSVSLYIYARSLCVHTLPDEILAKTAPIAKQLQTMGKETKNPKITLYLYLLLGEVYYVAAGYSMSDQAREYYEKSIMYNNLALTKVPTEINDIDKLVALRHIVASAGYANNSDLVSKIAKEARDIIAGTDLDTRIVGLHLCDTIAKSSVLTNIEQPVSLKSFAKNHYQGDIIGGGITEVSALKMEMDTLQLLGTHEEQYLKNLIFKGIILAERENATRHLNSFTKTLTSLDN